MSYLIISRDTGNIWASDLTATEAVAEAEHFEHSNGNIFDIISEDELESYLWGKKQAEKAEKEMAEAIARNRIRERMNKEQKTATPAETETETETVSVSPVTVIDLVINLLQHLKRML